MTTRLVYSKGVFGGGYSSGGGLGGGSCSLRRGTLVSATWAEGGSMYASVRLDGNDEASTFGVDWVMAAGQRVAVLFFGAQALVLPVASAIIEQALARAGEDMQAFVDALKDEIAAAKAEVEDELAEAKEELESAQEKLSQAQSDLDDLAAAAQDMAEQITGVTTRVNGVETDLSELSVELSGSITSLEGSLSAAVASIASLEGVVTAVRADLETAGGTLSAVATSVQGLTGFVDAFNSTLEAEGYTLSTLAESVQDSQGFVDTFNQTFATSDDEAVEVLRAFKQTVEGFMLAAETTYATQSAVAELSAAISLAEASILATVSGVYATKEAVATVSSTVEQLEDSWSVRIDSALEKADDAAKTATDFLEYSQTTGLTLGRMVDGAYTGMRTRITTSAFQVLDSGENVLSSFGADEALLGNASTSSVISLCGGSMTITGSSGGYGGSVANGRGASYGFATLDGAESFPVLRANSSSGASWALGAPTAATSTTYRQLYGAYPLWSNASGTQGSVTLSESASSIYVKGLVFVYGDGSRYLSQTLWDPNGRHVALSRAVFGGATAYCAASVYLVSGTAVTVQSSYSGQLTAAASGNAVGEGAHLYLYAVLGIM